MAEQILEINLISAQGLKPHASRSRPIQTYAVAWINSCAKLRTKIDNDGFDNPFWNDKLLFKVSPEFLSSETSGVYVEIYSVGYLRDHLIGTVRFLISTIELSTAANTPSFTALQIRRPSGRFRGVLNIGATLVEGSDFADLNGHSAIKGRDLIDETQRRKRSNERLKKSASTIDKFDTDSVVADCESWETSSGASPCSEHSTTSSSSTASTALKECNGAQDLARKNRIGKRTRVRSISESMLCGLLLKDKRMHSDPLDENSEVYGPGAQRKKE